MVMLLVFVIAAVVVIVGSSPVSADVQNAYQIPYQNWNCYPNSYYCNYPGYPPYPGYFNGNYYDPCQPIMITLFNVLDTYTKTQADA